MPENEILARNCRLLLRFDDHLCRMFLCYKGIMRKAPNAKYCVVDCQEILALCSSIRYAMERVEQSIKQYFKKIDDMNVEEIESRLQREKEGRFKKENIIQKLFLKKYNMKSIVQPIQDYEAYRLKMRRKNDMQQRTQGQDTERHLDDMERLKKERRIQIELQSALNREEKIQSSFNIQGLNRVIDLIAKFQQGK